MEKDRWHVEPKNPGREPEGLFAQEWKKILAES